MRGIISSKLFSMQQYEDISTSRDKMAAPLYQMGGGGR